MEERARVKNSEEDTKRRDLERTNNDFLKFKYDDAKQKEMKREQNIMHSKQVIA